VGALVRLAEGPSVPEGEGEVPRGEDGGPPTGVVPEAITSAPVALPVLLAVGAEGPPVIVNPEG
jgi:hypothetical protein